MSDRDAYDALPKVELHCHVEGTVRPFLAAVADTAVTDLTIEPARLEEAFLEFYNEREAR